MRRSDVAARALLLAAGAFTAAALSAQTGAPALTAEAMKPIAFRSLGPSLTTGRISDVAVDPKNPSVWYVAVGLGQSVEDGEPRQYLDGGLRRVRLLFARRGDRRSEGLERRLARHRREQQSAERRLRRRHLQVHRRGQDVEADGSRELRAHSEHPRRSPQFERRLRQRDRAAVVVGRRSRAVQDHRRRPDVEIGALGQRRHRRHRSRDGSEESRHPLRRRLSAPARRRTADWRRARERALQVDQCADRPGRS